MQIKFEIPLTAANGKGKRAEKFRREAASFIPHFPEFIHHSNHYRRYSMKVWFHYVAECNGDMDNRLLCIFDALKQRVIYDDFQIKELYCKMVEYSNKSAVIIELTELSTPTGIDSIKNT